MQAQAQQSMMNRLMGIITFKAPVYKEVAEDKSATTTALIIVVVVAVLTGLITGLIAGNLVFNLVTAVVIQLVLWVVSSWVLAFVAKQFFKGDTDTGEMLRITGYTNIFRILGIIPVIGGIIGGILQAVANIIGVREAAGFDTTKALLTAIIAWVIGLIIAAIITAIFTAIILVPAMINTTQ
jgi:hypothetical protein